jgi:glycosyltransferase involved in cell wall biosynthesis
MKILKLSTNEGGGATIAAERQAVALRESGCEVKHIFVKQDWEQSSTSILEEGDHIWVVPNMNNYIKTDLVFQNYIFDNRTDISNTYMSLWKIETEYDYAIVNYIKENEFDIIHLHWVSNLVSSNLLKLIQKTGIPVVITGHDMNHFTGACHYSAGCNKYQTDCMGCEQLVEDPMKLVSSSLMEKNNTFGELSPNFVFPSNWLNESYAKSLVGQNLGVNSSIVIRNCLDTDFFSPATESESKCIREKFNVADDELLVVSGAENNNEIRKGFEFFENAVNIINTLSFGMSKKIKIKFIAFGGGDYKLKCSNPNVTYLHLGILNEKQVRDLFRISDLLAFTSIEENFANIILESLMCGCPVVGFNIGGIPDILMNGVNGRLVEGKDHDEYAKVLSDVVLSDEIRALKVSTLKWRKKHFINYSKNTIALELTHLYQSLLGENNV